MKNEKPILFNTEMVKAVLDGKKTQTRRVIKFNKLSNIKKGRLFYSKTFNSWAIEGGEAHITLVDCPYGKIGDQLWVREKFAIGAVVGAENDESYLSQCKGENDIIPYEWCIREDIGIEEVKWKPSIFMPRSASRIQLKIKDIRVERVNDVEPGDCLSEGIEACDHYEENPFGCECVIFSFMDLWDSINKKRGYGWDKNPYVWVVEFEVI
jgi:hypothetical protein